MILNMITPLKPKLMEAELYCSIHLNEDQVSYAVVRDAALAEGFKEQVSRHITLLHRPSRDAINNKMLNLPESGKRDLLDEIKVLLNCFDWQFRQSKQAYHIDKIGTFGTGSTVIEHRESYISLVDMPDMAKFYDKLSDLLEAKLEPQFPHITLFTKGERPDAPYRGISIPSEEEFKKFCVGEI